MPSGTRDLTRTKLEALLRRPEGANTTFEAPAPLGVIDSAPWVGRPHPGRKTVPLPLTNAQRAGFETVLRNCAADVRLARRAQAALLLADGVCAPDVAQVLGVCERTVENWRKRFRVADPVAALMDAPRSGRRRMSAPRPTSMIAPPPRPLAEVGAAVAL